MFRIGYSPRMWRWSSLSLYGLRPCCVFSTYVEVILSATVNCWSVSLYSPRMWRWSCPQLWIADRSLCILHVCGGDPDNANSVVANSRYSPRMWRWSSPRIAAVIARIVFSTYVEVIPTSLKVAATFSSILHVCGGDPCFKPFKPAIWWYSPRMWRWSLEWQIHKRLKNVFSTYVEVILWQWHYILGSLGILHTCWECYCPWAHR